MAAPKPASLEVVNDWNGFIANFWRAVKHQPDKVAEWADYPVSHIDQGARHHWLMEQRDRLGSDLQDCDWPGDAKVAGWWLWGQCSWIGSGWCDWAGQVPHVSDAGRGIQAAGKVPHVSNAGRGIQAAGQVPHVSNAGRGIQAAGQVPHVSDAGRGIQAAGNVPHVSNAGRGLMTSSGRVAWKWLHELAERLERVRIVHGDWSRCLNNHYGGPSTAVFLDPPYLAYEKLYSDRAIPVAKQCEDWARKNAGIRVALCGHDGDYDLPGWTVHHWSRGRHTYSGNKTTDSERIWFSPHCLPPEGAVRQGVLF